MSVMILIGLVLVWSASEFRQGNIHFSLPDSSKSESYTGSSEIMPVGRSNYDRQWTAFLRQSMLSVLTEEVAQQGAKKGGGKIVLKRAGSGVFVHPRGYFLSSYSLVQDIKNLRVSVMDVNGKSHVIPAELIKGDPDTDTAILKVVSNKEFAWIPPGISSGILRGDYAYAVYLPGQTGSVSIVPAHLISTNETVTAGNKEFREVIRFNSSSESVVREGVLLNPEGRLVGIIIPQPANEQAGLAQTGIAVPFHKVREEFKDVVDFPGNSKYFVAAPGALRPEATIAREMNETIARGYGIPFSQGVILGEVKKGSQTDRMGFKTGDNLIKIDGRPVKNLNNFLQNWRNLSPDTASRVLMYRDGQRMELDISTPNQYANSALFSEDFVPGKSRWEIWSVPLDWAFGLMSLGFVSGLVGSMMSMGGGIIKVSGLLLLFGYGMVIVRPVAYLINVFVYGSAAYRYNFSRLILWDAIRPMIPFALGGLMLGYSFGILMQPDWIKKLLSIIAALASIRLIVESILNIKEETIRYKEDKPSTPGNRGWAGLPMGIASGIFGISGGVIEVPLQRYGLHIPLKNAIANAGVMILCTSTLGAFIALSHGALTGAFELKVPLYITLFLIPGAVAGGQCGTWVTTVAPINFLRWICSLLMFFVAYSLWVG